MAKDDQTAVSKSSSQYDPATPQKGWGTIWDLRDEIEGLFEDFFPGAAAGPQRHRRRRLGWGRHNGESAAAMSIPNIDVIDKKDELKLSAELPGMDEKDIDVQVSDGMLTLSGEKKHETEEGDKDGDYYMSERSFGSFKRTVRLPDGIDQDKIDAHFKNGLLTVHLPKKPDAQPTTRQIEVKAQK